MKNRQIYVVGKNIDKTKYDAYNVLDFIDLDNLQDVLIEIMNNKDSLFLIFVDNGWDIEIKKGYYQILLKLQLNMFVEYSFESLMTTSLNILELTKIVEDRIQIGRIIDNYMEGKKLCIIWGNCQTIVLSNLISTNREFCEKYRLVKIPRLWQNNNVEETELFINSGVLKKADILYIQNISNGSSFGISAATQNIIKQVRKSCKIRIITNLFFQSYFLQMKSLLKDIKIKNEVSRWKITNPILGCVDSNIIQLILEGMNEDEIVNVISDESFYDRKKIENEIMKELDLFEQRERTCDIKMHDFIKAFYDKNLLFVTNNHPTTIVMLEFAKRILNDLNIESKEMEFDDTDIQPPCPSNIRIPIYPSILKLFGFEEIIYDVKVDFVDVDINSFKNISCELDSWIEEYVKKTDLIGEKISLSMKANFNTFMIIYIRYIRSLLSVL